MGRGVVDFAAGKVGSTGNPELDYKLGKLMSDFKLAASAVGRTHFAGRTGLPAAQYFGELFNAKRSPEELLGVLDSVPSYIEGYTANSAITRQPRAGGGAQFGTEAQKKASSSNSPAPTHVINYNGSQYRYNGTGDTADIKNYTLVKAPQ